MDEPDPVPEAEGETKRGWKWSLFKRKPRERYTEYELPDSFYDIPVRSMHDFAPMTPPPSPYARQLADTEARLQLTGNELRALGSMPTHGGPRLTEAAREVLSSMGLVDTTHLTGSASSWNAQAASNHGNHGYYPLLSAHRWDDLAQPTPPPEDDEPGKIYR